MRAQAFCLERLHSALAEYAWVMPVPSRISEISRLSMTGSCVISSTTSGWQLMANMASEQECSTSLSLLFCSRRLRPCRTSCPRTLAMLMRHRIEEHRASSPESSIAQNFSAHSRPPCSISGTQCASSRLRLLSTSATRVMSARRSACAASSRRPSASSAAASSARRLSSEACRCSAAWLCASARSPPAQAAAASAPIRLAVATNRAPISTCPTGGSALRYPKAPRAVRCTSGSPPRPSAPPGSASAITAATSPLERNRSACSADPLRLAKARATMRATSGARSRSSTAVSVSRMPCCTMAAWLAASYSRLHSAPTTSAARLAAPSPAAVGSTGRLASCSVVTSSISTRGAPCATMRSTTIRFCDRVRLASAPATFTFRSKSRAPRPTSTSVGTAWSIFIFSSEEGPDPSFSLALRLHSAVAISRRSSSRCARSSAAAAAAPSSSTAAWASRSRAGTAPVRTILSRASAARLRLASAEASSTHRSSGRPSRAATAPRLGTMLRSTIVVRRYS
mmetsp:Transcript_28166/g.48873  ORF Transcript_28166/g.48873 Transcript_28166/m.48873 type:complete len:512 (-) Transcript_28166:1274-2809(-)